MINGIVVARAAVLDRSVATAGADHVGGIPERSLDFPCNTYHLNFPADQSWTRYNSLQRLAYFVTIFVAAPASILTGFMQEPGDLKPAGLVPAGYSTDRGLARSIFWRCGGFCFSFWST